MIRKLDFLQQNKEGNDFMNKKKLVSLLVTSMLTLNLVGWSSSSDKPEGEEKPAKEQAAANTLYTNGGPEEFFETPWLNPGSFVYN